MTTKVREEVMDMRGAIRAALFDAMASDERVILLGEDVGDPAGGVFRVTEGLQREFGERVRPTPIAEQAIVGAAIGAALGGLLPVAEIMFMDFTAVCIDQIVNHAAKLRYMSGGRTPVPLTIRTATGAGIRIAAQHTQSLEAWFVHTPGLKVVMPSTAADAKGLLTSCIFDEDPCVFVEPIALLFTARDPVPEGTHTVPLGRADVKRSGDDATVIAYGRQVPHALAAAERLESEDGIGVEVLDLRSLVPLDEAAILASVARTKRAVVVHDAVRRCGVGAEVSSRIHEELFGELAAPVRRLGAASTPVPYAQGLMDAMLPGPADIVAAVRDVVG